MSTGAGCAFTNSNEVFYQVTLWKQATSEGKIISFTTNYPFF